MDFNSILIGSADPKRLVDYYTKLFGPPTFTDDEYSGWQLGSGFVTIGPHSEVAGSNPQPGRLIWNVESKDVAGEFDEAQGGRRDRRPRAVRVRGRAGLVDRDAGRP